MAQQAELSFHHTTATPHREASLDPHIQYGSCSNTRSSRAGFAQSQTRCSLFLLPIPHHPSLGIDQAASDSSIHDPSLSDLGMRQCARLKAHLKTELPAEMVENIGLILVSPMRRTIQTALWSMDWLLQKGVPIQASAGWQGKQTT